MKIKRSEVLKLEGAFSSLLEIRIEPAAAFKIASNLILANDISEKVRKSYKPVDGHEEFVKKRRDILSGFGSVNGGVSVPAGKADAVKKKLDDLADENADMIDAQKEYDDKFNEVLEFEDDVNFEKITMDELMIDGIEPSKLVSLIQNGIISNGNKS